MSSSGLCCALLCIAVLAIPVQTRAQAADTTLPSSIGETGMLGQPQLVEADVGAGTPIERIDLHYRFDGGEYTTIPMGPTNEPGIYAAEVPTRGIRAERMEFYIIAEDASGGELLKGSESLPLSRELARTSASSPGIDAPREPSTVAGAGPEGPSATSSSGMRKYLYYALGVLAVGAIVAAANSGDGDSSETDECGADGCDLPLVSPPTR